MVLNHIAKGANGVVEAPPVLNVESFRHGDLDAANIVAVPQRLEHRIGEPRIEDVLNRLLAQIVVDAKDRIFGKMLEQRVVERLADSRSRPNGFSTTRRASTLRPALASAETTTPNRLGGIAR